MRKLFIFLMIVCLTLPVFSQMTFEELQDNFQSFTDGVATTLPFNSILGLNWSDAYIGNFPHFGVGVTLGMAFMPYGNLEDTMNGLGVDLDTVPTEIADLLTGLGMPFPTLALEGRMGGFALPFDIGAKIGFISPDWEIPMTGGLVMDYLLVGADVRFRIIQGALIIPTVSAGGGFCYQSGSVDMPSMLGSSQTISDFGGGHTLSMSDPSLNFNWKTFVIDLKAQASWNLLFITPYAGVGAAYALYAEAGGGMKSDILYDGSPITQSEIDAMNSYYGSDINLTDSQILVSATTPAAWSLRAYAGVSLNLLMVKLDLLGLYNIASGGLGLSLNLRVQL